MTQDNKKAWIDPYCDYPVEYDSIIDKQILVTGGSGLVGSAVVRKIKQTGCMNIFAPSHHELDLLDFNAVLDYIMHNNIDTVVHCAGSVAGIIGNSRDNYGQLFKNLQMGMNVIHAFKNVVDYRAMSRQIRVGDMKLMFLGSTCIYPRDAKQPIEEESLLTGPLEKTNEGYALAKISCIKMCEYLNNMPMYKGSFISCMPTNVYGANDSYQPQRSHVFPALVRKICDAKASGSQTVKIGGDGTPVRSFICSDDLADAILFLLKNYDGSDHINVGCQRSISIRELAQKIAKEVGYDGKFEYDETIPNGTPVKVEDTSKLNSLGWKSSISLEDGIKIEIKDYFRYKNKSRNI